MKKSYLFFIRALTIIGLLIIIESALCAKKKISPTNFPNFLIKEGYLFDKDVVAGTARDAIKVVNMTNLDPLSFDLYFYVDNQKTWVLYGMIDSSPYYRAQKIESPYEDLLSSFRYYAIVPTGESVTAPIRYEIKIIHHDIYIYLYLLEDFSLTSEEVSHAAIIDLSTIEGKDFSNIIFYGAKGRAEGFWLYAFNDEDGQWTRLGLVITDKKVRKKKLLTPIKDLMQFNYLVISAQSGLNYSFDLKKTRGDLIIKVLE